ncbi:MAG: hypothetical protein AAF223_09020 [Bacteroidota bacterium]
MYVHLDGNQNELQNWSLEKLGTDPTGGDLYEGRIWENTGDNSVRYYDGTAVQTLATLEDLTSIGNFQGVHDASGGAVPSTTADGSAIVAGDFWRVSVAGTIVGIGGDDVLEVGDLIFANIPAATAAADFTAVQANLNLSGALAQVEEVTLATLPASTPTAVPTTFTNAYNIQVFDSADEEIGVKIAGPTTAPTIESNQALANLKIRVSGN